jgi:hypothetical protein
MEITGELAIRRRGIPGLFNPHRGLSAHLPPVEEPPPGPESPEREPPDNEPPEPPIEEPPIEVDRAAKTRNHENAERSEVSLGSVALPRCSMRETAADRRRNGARSSDELPDWLAFCC